LSQSNDEFASTLVETPTETNTPRRSTSSNLSQPGAVDPTDEPPVPEIVADRYRVVGPAGSGGFGVVYEAVDQRLQKTVALKLLSARHARDQVLVERFRAEALAAGRLDHPNIVGVTDFDILEDGRPFLVMDFVEGESFDEVLRRVGPLPVAAAARISETLCRALAVAHEAGIVHRDLKPTNILIGGDVMTPTLIKIFDFGIAKLLAGQNAGSLTQTGQMLGTPAYMAPEQVRQRGPLDGRADVYSVGIILYQMLTGQTPFAGRGPGDVMVSKVIEKPEPPSQLNPSIPAELERLILRAIRAKPDERIASATAMADALAPFARPTAETAEPTRRSWPAWRTWTLVAAAAVIASAWLLARGRGSDGAGRGDERSPAPASVAPAALTPTTPTITPGPADEPDLGAEAAATSPTGEPAGAGSDAAEAARTDVPPGAGAAPPDTASTRRDRSSRPTREPTPPAPQLPDAPLHRLRVPR
jgi:serine/threonine-protein kinase